ncbi:DUF6892 domain-containing protein [Chitinophaga vietnamensis]|uniref:DUF6892 domain-containing protein n=1 Tax=Chitinophaga vietnamensis TaxID=2593957 RepID=UPI00117849BF|nr:hypothetical protein [Chitinophaga vietnamensis]
MQLSILHHQLAINNVEMQFPLDIQQLQSVLGQARYLPKKYNHVYTWDDHGIIAYSKKGQEVESLSLDLVPEDMDLSPAKLFTAPFTIDGTDFREYLQQHKQDLPKASKHSDDRSLIAGDIQVWFNIDDDVLTSIGLSQYEAPPAKVYSDKYHYKPIDGEKIEFADFNFKLAVIQELMYNQELITPKFNLYDFVDNYQAREIDIEKEGYDFIPEVSAYFKSLEIDKKFADKITHITQDGGDDIYGHMLRFWDGEDDSFNIRNFEDVKHFSNLRYMNLFYSEDLPEIKAALAAKNITVESV